MNTFQVGETIVCCISVKDINGSLQNVANAMNIGIAREIPNYAAVVNATGMTNDGTGLYHYDCATTNFVPGDYKVTYTATDGTRITIENATFTLE
jgi:hypothetical protein